MKYAPIILAALLIASGAGIASGLSMPRDLDGDGLYEDVNGNGRPDFADVTTLYGHLDAWAPVPFLATMFDFDHNGRLDLADVVVLFNTL